MNVDLPMDGQPVWLVSGICFAGSGQTISKEHFLGFESILGNTTRIRVGAGNGYSSTAADKAVADAFGDRFFIPLDFELLESHMPF